MKNKNVSIFSGWGYLFIFCLLCWSLLWSGEAIKVITVTLRPYVISSHENVTLQDLVVEKLFTNVVLKEKKNLYTASDISKMLKQIGIKDFIILGKEVTIFYGVTFFTPEEWYIKISRTYPEVHLESIELPEKFEVVSEVIWPEGVELVCRIFNAQNWSILTFFIPRRKYMTSSRPSFFPYKLEWIGEKNALLTYQSHTLSIRIPVRVISSPQSDVVLLENRINSRILRLKREEVEGL